MRAVVQRVLSARVSVEGELVSSIGPGLLVLAGVAADDAETDATALARKITALRIFEDDRGKMHRSVADTGGEILSVSQFTLLGDCRSGNRPDFGAAAPASRARELYEAFLAQLRLTGTTVRDGVFGAHMAVELVNDGPVTLLLDTRA